MIRYCRPVGRGRVALNLVEELGLQRHTLISSPSAANRYLWHGGELVALPSKPGQALSNGLIRQVVRDTLRRDVGGASRDPPHIVSSSPELSPPHDESVYSFALRHFGPVTAGVLLDAALSGIYAGNVHQLSAKSVLGSLWKAEFGPGTGNPPSGGASASVLISLLKRRGSKEADAENAAELRARASESQFVRACRLSSSVSFTGGLAMLPDALAASLLDGRSFSKAAASVDTSALGSSSTVEIVTGTRVSQLRPVGDSGIQISTSSSDGRAGSFIADHVICALPAPALSGALAGLGAPALPTRDALDAIPFGSVAVVNFGYRRRRVLPPGLAGFGYLVPSGDRVWRQGAAVGPTEAGSSAGGSSTGVLGMTWDSDVFPGQSESFVADSESGFVRQRRHPQSGELLPWGAEDVPVGAREGETRLTVMVGGATVPREVLLGLTQQQLIAVALRAAREHLGILAQPDAVAVNVASDAIPQYTVGHSARVESVMAGARALFGPRLRVIGNSFSGIGLSDTIANAVEAGAGLAELLGTSQPAP